MLGTTGPSLESVADVDSAVAVLASRLWARRIARLSILARTLRQPYGMYTCADILRAYSLFSLISPTPAENALGGARALAF
jgi:hypothetical protein